MSRSDPLTTSDCILAQLRLAEYAYARDWYTTCSVDQTSGPDVAKSPPSFDGLRTILVRKISTIVNLLSKLNWDIDKQTKYSPLASLPAETAISAGMQA
jgi:hypothetical protein